MTELGIYHKWEKIGVYMNIYQVVSLTEYLYCLEWSILKINVYAAYKVPLFLLTYQERSIGEGVG